MLKVKRKSKEEVLQINKKGELIYLSFPSLEKIDFIRHGFSTRIGGVSEGMFGTMNLSYHRGDRKEAVDENFRRLAKALEVDADQFVFSKQTHTTNIRIVTKEDAGKGFHKPLDYDDVDGLVTNLPGIVLATFFADCVPVFLVDPVHKAIGMIHSGWRGSVGKIAKKAVEVMNKEFGSEPKDIYAAIGPSICKECYEVSEDVKEEVEKAFQDKDIKDMIFPKGNGKYLLDLWKVNEVVLREAGILQNHIEVTDICTCCNPEFLFSHRASQGKRGNLGAFLSIKEP